MRAFLALLMGAAAIVTSVPPAEARDGCGRGLHWNGYRCVPYGPPAYGPPGYGPPPYGYYAPRPRYEYRPDLAPYGSCVPRTNPAWPCPCDNWTVQGGVCKPYSGR